MMFTYIVYLYVYTVLLLFSFYNILLYLYKTAKLLHQYFNLISHSFNFL